MTAPRPLIPGLPPDAPEYRAARRSALRDYLSANEERFTRDALMRSALEAGYEQAEVDAGFAHDVRRVRSTAFSSCASLLTTGLYVAGFALGLLLVLSQPGTPLAPGFLLAVFLVGVVGAILFRGRRPDIAMGLGLGVVVLFLIPMALFVAILGICTVTGFRVI